MFSKRLIALAAAGAFAASASVAGAQVVLGSDGGPHDDAQPVVITHNCGVVQQSIVKTQNHTVTSNVPGYNPVPGMQWNFNVAGGQSRCLKLLFTAESACTGYVGDDFCYVRALVDGVPMDPDGANFQALDSEDATASAHAYEWIKHVGAGNHLITIERRVGNAATSFDLDDYTGDLTIQQ
jgi:hypothetical protein